MWFDALNMDFLWSVMVCSWSKGLVIMVEQVILFRVLLIKVYFLRGSLVVMVSSIVVKLVLL